jgi:hypothetical protein
MWRDQRGQIRIIEVFFAIVIVSSALLSLRQIQQVSSGPTHNDVFYAIGVNVLVELQREGGLSDLVRQRNWVTLASQLNLLLPLTISYNVTVYNAQNEVVNTAFIARGSIQATSVVTIRYLLAEPETLQFYTIQLALAWMT